MKQKKLRTEDLEHTNNISFPIGTAIAVKKYSQKLNFEDILSQFKKHNN